MKIAGILCRKDYQLAITMLYKIFLRNCKHNTNCVDLDWVHDNPFVLTAEAFRWWHLSSLFCFECEFGAHAFITLPNRFTEIVGLGLR